MSWERVALRDLGQWFGGATPSKGNTAFWTDGSIPWLSPKDMGPMVLAETKDHITTDAVSGSSVRIVPANSVAVVARSGILERKLPVASVPFETTLNQDMKAVVPRPGIDPRWVAWGLRAFERELLRTTRKAGTTVASIEMPRFNQFRLPVPDLVEQRRIVEILEDHLLRIDMATSSVHSAARRLEVLDRSLHQVALHGGLVPDDFSAGTGADLIGDHSPLDVTSVEDRTWPVPPSWVWARVGDLFRVAVGTTPPRADATLWNGTVPWVSSGEVAFNRIKSTRESITEAAAGNIDRRVHPPGTVMVAMIGEGKTRGQAAILDIAAAHNQNCASIRVSETDVLPEFVYAFFKERYLETRRGSSGGNQPALNKGRIESIPMPVPPLGTQRRIVAELERLEGLIGHVRVECETQLQRADSLRRGVLRAAFEGQLTGRGTDSDVIEELSYA